MPGIKTRVVDAYVYHQTKNDIRFLLLKRARTKMYEHLWQGVAGKIEKGEKPGKQSPVSLMRKPD